MFPHCKISETQLNEHYKTITRDDVIASLSKEKPAFSDLINLLSPAAASCIPEMRRLSAKIKYMHFGKTVRFYAPLYISSYCINDCAYCGFRSTFHYNRKRLSMDEVLKDARIIHSYGIDSLLLIAGEDHRIDADFLVEVLAELKKLFSYISMEFYPMEASDYRKVFNAGIHGMTMYQETYQQDLYKQLHRGGPKTDYERRLRAPADAANAGFYNIGLGTLLGLYDWRIEAVSLAAHGLWIRKNFWKTRIQFSFPRITHVDGDFKVPAVLSEAELEQMMLAFRIFFPEADLFISTRENHEFRRKMALNCVSHMSAGSKVVPGAYAAAEEKKSALGQFTVVDPASVEAVKDDIESLGLEVIFKDWDPCLGKSAGA